MSGAPDMRCAPAATVSAGLAFARRWWAKRGGSGVVVSYLMVLRLSNWCYRLSPDAMASSCSVSCSQPLRKEPRRRRSAAVRSLPLPACPIPPPVNVTGITDHVPCPQPLASLAGADAKRPARRGAWAGSRTEQTNGLSSVYHPMSVTATMFGNSRGNICALPGGGAARRAKPGQVAKTGGMQGMGMKLSGQPTVLVERRKNFFRNILPILTF